MQFTSQILVERTRANERASVKEQGELNSEISSSLDNKAILNIWSKKQHKGVVNSEGYNVEPLTC